MEISLVMLSVFRAVGRPPLRAGREISVYEKQASVGSLTVWLYLYCYTVQLVDSLIITQPTNALIVCHLF